MSPSPSSLSGAIAATRFGLGARPGEIAQASRDPRGWLLAQIEPGAAPSFPGLGGSADRLVAATQADRVDRAGGAGQQLRNAWAQSELMARTRNAITTPNSFRERWTLFWLNHFALQASGGDVEMLSGSFAREAIEPHQFGRFEDLLVASTEHPAMLLALNQTESVGPDSPAGRAERRGINENLAREVMELHSLGVDGGYDQADVRELAYALTGWTVADPAGPPESRGRFTFDPSRRQPGSRRLLGRDYAQSPEQTEAMLRDLARRPQTYRRIAFKLARHLVADSPDPELVAHLAQALSSSGGSLAALATALVEAPQAWAPAQAKFKTPFEYLVSVHRAADAMPDSGEVLALCSAMGHSPLWAPAARGASDAAQSWATSLALSQRADLARTMSGKSGAERGLELAETALGRLLTASTRKVLSDSGDAASTGGLALMSPEFLRR